MPEVDDIMPEAMDNYIGVEIMIYHGDTVAQGSVRHRKRDVEGNTIGRANSNPIIDNRTYEVEFEDVSMITYSKTFIAELCMISVMRREINTSCLGQYCITRHMGMPYRWKINIRLYVGKVQNAKTRMVGPCVSNVRMEQQHGRGYQTSRNIIPSRFQSTHLKRGSLMSLP